MPYYEFEKFKRACGEDVANVIPIGEVLKDAKQYFNLSTKSELLIFINNDGLENLSFVNTKDWENNPNPQIEIKVDAYEFRTLGKLGYIAFMQSSTQKWLIKSFKLSKNSTSTMYSALQKAGLVKPEENK